MPRWVDHSAPKLRGLRHNVFHPEVCYPCEEFLVGACPECAGAGEVLEQLDDDRFPEPVPCQRCQFYCQECKKWAAKKNHEHAKK
jgi:hypothetical protein